MSIDELVDRARALVNGGDADPTMSGFTRLSGGMTNEVFSFADDPSRVVKVFRTAGGAAEREWDALVALAGSGIAPEPVHFAARDDLSVVVMTRLTGSTLPAAALGANHAGTIGTMHRAIHSMVPATRRPQSYAGVLALKTALMTDEPQRESDAGTWSALVALAWQAARTWIVTADVEHLFSPDALCFSRGDPNLTNYLWSDSGLVLVDWENSGFNNPALELADMAEHASTRELGDDFWDQVADATELDETDKAGVQHGRRLMACLWLVLIESRQREGLPTTVTLDEQATRTLAILDV